jgi:hypothetical protein
MRTSVVVLLIATLSVPLIAQPSSSRRLERPQSRSMQAGTAESAIKQAMEQLAATRAKCDRDLEVLRHVRAADDALIDPMQPHNSIEKALEEISAAKLLNPELLVQQGLIAGERALEGARLSPGTADFGRLRGIIRTEAAGPAVRVVARNGAALQEEALAWLRVQELISSHLRTVVEISAESLRAAQQ